MSIKPIVSSMTAQVQQPQRPVAPTAEADKSVAAARDQSAYVDTAFPAPARTENREQNGEQGNGRETDNQQISTEQIKKAVDKINRRMTHSEAVFGIHEATNRVTIKIVDKETKELIQELPPEKTLDMISKVWELAGILVDEKR